MDKPSEDTRKKPDALKQALRVWLEPAGIHYEFNVIPKKGQTAATLQEEFPEWMNDLHTKAEKVGRFMVRYDLDEQGQNYIWDKGNSDGMKSIGCVMMPENLARLLKYLQDRRYLKIHKDSFKAFETVYAIRDEDVEKLLEDNKEAIKDWMKLQILKDPSASPSELASWFNADYHIARTTESPYKNDSDAIEYRWASRLIQEMIQHKELHQTKYIKFNGDRHTTLSVPDENYTTEWLETPDLNDGRFCITKYTKQAMVSIRQDDDGRYHVVSMKNRRHSRPKTVYRTKDIDEAKKAGEACFAGKSVPVR